MATDDPKKNLVTPTFQQDLKDKIDDEDERPPFEERLIQACKEVNLMRKGLMPERTWDELKAILEKEIADDETTEQQIRKVAARA